ncbi:serine/threonine protein kinase [Fonticula alba]|uniref:Serine/threonine protein kinase n=1 Tax=Fonticula alba TaxID=691883 RepID=A0A058ZDG5_FONAL|nr:serine/threonine protein kinase [Fonticula alba]KCV72439.1 serine/threonine protein kinase [Fonticula alba]|eukprot:XP_009492140.1 serine/threonine protein kinase [Fonticula alba]
MTARACTPSQGRCLSSLVSLSLLACLLLLAHVQDVARGVAPPAPGAASPAGLTEPPGLAATTLAFRLVTRVAHPDAVSPSDRANIQFCDFFNAQSLQPFTGDGFDDLAYMSSFYSLATSPLARAGLPSSRPREFLPGPPLRTHRCFSYPFARKPLSPFCQILDVISPELSYIQEIFSVGNQAIYHAEGFMQSGATLFDPASVVVGTSLAGSSFLLQPDSLWSKLQFNFFDDVGSSTHSLMQGFRGFEFLQATDLDGDGLVDAVTVASPPGAVLPAGRGIYWLNRLGEAALTPDSPADVSLLLPLPVDMEVGQLLVGDFDGDGLASDLVVVSGARSTGPARIIILLTSDLSAPVTISLSEMATNDPALAAVPQNQHYPKAAAARLTTPAADDLVVAFGSRVWLIPGPLHPASTSTARQLSTLGATPLLPDHPSSSGVWRSVAFGDFDADGRLDMALAHSTTGGDIFLLSQVDATPACLCGPGGICLPGAGGFYSVPTCGCEDPNADPDFKLAPCEFCRPGFFRTDEKSPCQLCHGNCNTCSGTQESDCLSCPARFILVVERPPTGRCVPADPSTTVTLLRPAPERPYYQAGSEIALDSAPMSAAPILVADLLRRTVSVPETRMMHTYSTSPTVSHSLEAISTVNRILLLQEDIHGAGLILHRELTPEVRSAHVPSAEGLHRVLIGYGSFAMCADNPPSIPKGLCSRFNTYPLSGSADLSLGRLAPGLQAGDSPRLGILSRDRFGTRPLAKTHVFSSLWLDADNGMGLDSPVVLHSAGISGQSLCWLGWQPRLANDLVITVPIVDPVRILDEPMPCGKLLRLPPPMPGSRSSLLLVSGSPDSGEAVLYLLRNRGRGQDFRPRFEAPLPLLTAADLGYLPGTRLVGVQAAIDPKALTPTEAGLFLWEGTWVFRVTVSQDVSPGAGQPDRVTVSVEPVIPRDSFSSFTEGLIMLSIDADGDGAGDLALLSSKSQKLVLFRRASERNGCGCGRASVCNIPSTWGEHHCDATDAPPSCLPQHTSLRVPDLCTCAPGLRSPADGSSLCSQCDSSTGDFPPEFGVDCAPCDVDGCMLCDTSGQCLRCRPGLVRTPAGECATNCPDPDAPVVDAVCQTPEPADTWISSAEVQADPSWAGFRVVDVSTLRAVAQDGAVEGSRAVSTTFPTLHVLQPEYPHFGTSQSVWLLPLARLLADGRPATFGRLDLVSASQWLDDVCTLVASPDVQLAAIQQDAAGEDETRPLTALSASVLQSNLGALPGGQNGDFAAAGVPAPSGNVKRIGIELVDRSILNKQYLPIRRPWFSQLSQPFPSAGLEPVPTMTPDSPVLHFQRSMDFFYEVIEMHPNPLQGFDPPPVLPSDFRTCSMSWDLLPAKTRLTVKGSPELANMSGKATCTIQRVWVPFSVSELSFHPRLPGWFITHDAHMMLRRPTTPGARPSVVILLFVKKQPPGVTGCPFQLLEVPLTAGASSLPVFRSIQSFLTISPVLFFVRVPSVRDFNPDASASGPGVVAVAGPNMVSNSLAVALSPNEPAEVDLQMVSLNLSENVLHMVFVRTDGLPDSIMALPYPCLALKHADWKDAAPGHGSPDRMWPTDRPTYGCAPLLLETRALVSGGPHGRPVVLAKDMDSDGMDDLLLHWPATGRVVVYSTLNTVPVTFRQSIIFPGQVPESPSTAAMQSVEYPALADPQLLLVDVDGDRFVDVVLLDQASPSGTLSASSAPVPVIRVFGRSDQTSNWCPAEVDYDPVAGECVCPGRLRHLTPLSDACECITHAVPVAPGAPDCVCPVGMAEGVGACVCQPGLLPVASESTGAPVSPPRCETCHASCASCSATRSGLCASCPPGHFLQAGVCVTACGPGFTISADGRECIACAASCSTCLGPASNQCSACAGNRYLPGGMPGTCRSCNAACSGCTGPAASQCTVCATGWLRAPSGECVRTCPEGTGISSPGSSQCKACADAGCLSCVTAQAGAICRACRTGLQIDATGKQCLQCHGTCATCDGNGLANCLTCAPGLLLHGSSCVASCPEGTFPEAGAACSRCSGRCATCSGPLSTHCLTCPPEWVLQEDGTCLPDPCPTCGDCDDIDCESCSPANPGVCLICAAGKLLLPDGTCCQDSPGFCTQCPAGKLLGTTPGTCVDRCGDREFADLTTPSMARCAACHNSCASCEGGAKPEDCTACSPGLFLLAGVGCVGACPSGYFVEEGPLAGSQACAPCVAECAECTGADAGHCTRCMDDRLLMVGSGYCRPVGEDTCPAGWHADLPGRRCLRCPDGCLACPASVEDCEQCSADMRSIRLLDREATDAAPVGSGPRTCVAMCPGGWFAPEGQADVCSACDMACGTCSGPGPDGCLEPNCDQPGSCPKTGSRSLALAIALPLALLLLLLLILLLVLVLLRRRRRHAGAKEGDAIPMQYIGDPEDMTVMNTMLELSLPGHLLLNPEVDYRIEPGCEELGKGAQAVVLPCTLLRADLCTAAGGDAGAVKMVPTDSPFRTQFEPLLDQEIAILSILLADGGSPFVCQLVGYSAAPSKALVMPHYPGLLSDLLWPSRLSPAQTLQMAADIAAGMAFIHSRGVVHKDLKPENIFLRPDPADPGRLQPVIGDFGVALVLNRFSVIPTLGNVAAGSLPYASPETLARLYGMTFPLAPSDSSVVSLLKVDIYSLGVLLFGLVAAARPWTGTGSDDVATAVLAGKRPDMNPSSGTPVPVLVGDTGSEPAWMAEYRQIYREAWAADPRERPSAAKLAATLIDLAERESPAVSPS